MIISLTWGGWWEVVFPLNHTFKSWKLLCYVSKRYNLPIYAPIEIPLNPLHFLCQCSIFQVFTAIVFTTAFLDFPDFPSSSLWFTQWKSTLQIYTQIQSFSKIHSLCLLWLFEDVEEEIEELWEEIPYRTEKVRQIF